GFARLRALLPRRQLACAGERRRRPRPLHRRRRRRGGRRRGRGTADARRRRDLRDRAAAGSGVAPPTHGGHYHAPPAPPPTRRSALTITDRPEDSLAVHGLRAEGHVMRNPTTSQLYTAALERREPVHAEDGPLVVDTGRFTRPATYDR